MLYSYQYKKNCVYDSHAAFLLLYLFPFFFLPLLYTNPFYLAVISFIFLSIMYLGQSQEKILPFIRFALYLSIFTFILNILLRDDGNTVLYQSSIQFPITGRIIITKESLVISLIMVFQLSLIFFSFALLNTFINPDDLMKTFRKMKMPFLLYFLFTVSTRFFPVLLDDLENIKDAQQLRGLKLESGNLISRLKNRVSLILPLLSNSLERTIQIAETLEARGFGVTPSVNKNPISPKTPQKLHRSIYNYVPLSFGQKLIIAGHYLSLGIILWFRAVSDYGVWEITPVYHFIVLSTGDWILLFLYIFDSGLILTYLYWTWRQFHG